jgi:hypothetical protein
VLYYACFCLCLDYWILLTSEKVSSVDDERREVTDVGQIDWCLFVVFCFTRCLTGPFSSPVHVVLGSINLDVDI